MLARCMKCGVVSDITRPPACQCGSGFAPLPPPVASVVGRPAPPPPPQVVIQNIQRPRELSHCSRITYIIFAFFLGSLGVHNFYAGRHIAGACQLLISFASYPLMFVGVGCFTVFIPPLWAFLDILFVSRDGQGYVMG